jgi:hypothetical protein
MKDFFSAKVMNRKNELTRKNILGCLALAESSD